MKTTISQDFSLAPVSDALSFAPMTNDGAMPSLAMPEDDARHDASRIAILDYLTLASPSPSLSLNNASQGVGTAPALKVTKAPQSTVEESTISPDSSNSGEAKSPTTRVIGEPEPGDDPEPTAEYWLNSEYTDEDLADSYKFNNLNDLLNATPAAKKIYVKGGSYNESLGFEGKTTVIEAGTFNANVHGSNDDLNTATGRGYLIVDGGTFNRVYAGDLLSGGTVDNLFYSQGLRVTGGVFNGAVCAGSRLMDGTLAARGNTQLYITGGTFNKIVCATHNMDTSAANAAISLKGDITLNISGGTFNKKIFAGILSTYLANSANATQEGNINVTVDTSQKPVTINGPYFVVGPSGNGSVNGKVQLTITGDNPLNFRGYFVGGRENQAYNVSSPADGKNDTPIDNGVSGTSTVLFDDFRGTLKCTFRGFDTFKVINQSNVTFKNSAFQIKNIVNWNIATESTVNCNFSNGFEGDNINILLTDLDTDEWTLFRGGAQSFLGFENAASVTLCGQSAAWDDSLSAWVSKNFQLSVVPDTGYAQKMVMAFIE